ncbi:CaiB/BaiF CoA transferase family protein [Paraburkholderia elongata]|uniref:CoA transferase n=1 Tax=Paraburkholderia elongata TaxID=2675747 RepID=A0A972NMP7_9BURK|nr:CoA transferase [Paraburkholderia elongata]NPT55084.1 CoA transferase [Paraburkholderia elongata]
MAGPLDGIRVVDFSRVLAGPLCAKTLLDLGADVVKIEPPRPDISRLAFPGHAGISGYYAQQNAGKRNVSIDLNVPGARELVLRLCDEADVVVENFRAGTLNFFGLDYETLSARNPRLIYLSITGYGQGGPWMHRMAYAPTVQAEAGLTRHSLDHYGDALAQPRTDSLSHADVYAGLQASIAILAALVRRAQTGIGQYIDVSMAAALTSANEKAHVYLSGADLAAEPAILGATDCPFFEGPSGEQIVLSMSLVGSVTFPFYLRAMRRPELAADPRFSSAAARRKHRSELHALVQNWMYTFRTLEALDAQLDEAKIAMGRLRTMQDIAESDWANYWGAVQTVSDRHGGSFRLPGRPWRFSRDALPAAGLPAFQGEHNRTVFEAYGLTAAELDAYEHSGAFVQIHRENSNPGDEVETPQVA